MIKYSRSQLPFINFFFKVEDLSHVYLFRQWNAKMKKHGLPVYNYVLGNRIVELPKRVRGDLFIHAYFNWSNQRYEFNFTTRPIAKSSHFDLKPKVLFCRFDTNQAGQVKPSLVKQATTEKKFEKLTGLKYRNSEEFANG